METKRKGFAFYMLTGAWWIADGLWKDDVFKWAKPRLPEFIVNPPVAGLISAVSTFGVPLALFILGTYFYFRKPPLESEEPGFVLQSGRAAIGMARTWAARVEPSHIIILGLAIALCGVVFQMRRGLPPDPRVAELQSQVVRPQQQAAKPEVQQQSITKENTWINDARIEGGSSDAPLKLAGTFARSGKSLKFVIDIWIDTQTRGENLRRVPRMKIDEVANFVRGAAVQAIVVSYFDPEHLVPMWGRRRELSGIEDEAFQLTSLVKAEISSIDENEKENRIIGFTIFPKINPYEFRQLALAANDRVPPEPPPKLSWQNVIVYPEGALTKLDSKP